jgi:hypothetical protein
MDYQTFSIVVASLQSAAVHVMTPEQFEAFTSSIKAMREDRMPPKYIVASLSGQINDIVRTQEWQRS